MIVYTLAVLHVLALSLAAQVPTECSVDKQTGHVDCRNRNLISIPKDLPAETRILDLSGNKIHQLDVSSFKNCPFVTEIYLARNELTSIQYATFTNLQHLKVLDVSNNRLSHFNVDIPVFVDALYLNNNPLSSGHIFQQRLIYVKYLSLAGTNMTQPSIFSSFLPNLQYLDLRDIPDLTLSIEDLKKLRHLRTLYISPRMFSGRNRSQKCREFIKAAREFKTEVKAFSCFPQENFAIKARTFERAYQVDEAMYDRPDNVLNVEITNATGLNELQVLVSDGVTNFIKSILVEKEQHKLSTSYKIKEPIPLEDYTSPNKEIHLAEVRMSGFPALRPQNPAVLEFMTVDAEELKRFRASYRTVENKRDLIVTGFYRVYSDVGNFTCKFTNTNYESTRQMVRRYDFLTWPTNVKEVLQFDKMDCQAKSTNSAMNSVGHVIDPVLTALSKPWLDTVTNLANAVSSEPAIRNISQSFTQMYRERVLSKVIGASLDYLKNINVDSFDVTPTFSPAANDSGAIELTVPDQYNVKIVNLFNYTDNKIEYAVDETMADTMKILGKYFVFYHSSAPAVLTISAKDNPQDMMKVVISSIEFDVHFEVTSVNQVHRFSIPHVNARVVETDSEKTNILYLMFKKYLGIELSKELRRSLTYLTNKVDFYSLNVL